MIFKLNLVFRGLGLKGQSIKIFIIIRFLIPKYLLYPRRSPVAEYLTSPMGKTDVQFIPNQIFQYILLIGENMRQLTAATRFTEYETFCNVHSQRIFRQNEQKWWANLRMSFQTRAVWFGVVFHSPSPDTLVCDM